MRRGTADRIRVLGCPARTERGVTEATHVPDLFALHGEASPWPSLLLSGMSYWTAADLPSFVGRTAIITGANSGLGAVTARELARNGAKIIMAVRNTNKGEAAKQQMSGDIEVRQLDLQDLSSVRQFA